MAETQQGGLSGWGELEEDQRRKIMLIKMEQGGKLFGYLLC
ncbi:MAG TPA: hypothetical protein VJ933_06630 [Phaeodactylibacter sp.]|nr:hypothetical protein [Phaeodactylibacter sp.]